MDNKVSEDQALNEILVEIFHEIVELEGKALITGKFSEISVNDMHIIEAIGINEPKRMSEIAKRMNVTLGTLTTAIDSLNRKGYVNRTRDTKDRRVVNISLTEKGIKAFRHHEKFHQTMIEQIKNHLNCEERRVLSETLQKLIDYFKQIY
ncbi:MAG: MarR family winged helix-turn-helix transcriptional regulator [Lachnospiraceae bacterium]